MVSSLCSWSQMIQKMEDLGLGDNLTVRISRMLEGWRLVGCELTVEVAALKALRSSPKRWNVTLRSPSTWLCCLLHARALSRKFFHKLYRLCRLFLPIPDTTDYLIIGTDYAYGRCIGTALVVVVILVLVVVVVVEIVVVITHTQARAHAH